MKTGNTVDDEKLYEHAVIGVVLVFGTLAGVLVQMAGDEVVRPWRQVVASAILNGMFTGGVYAVLLYLHSDMLPIIAALIAGAASTLGRSTFLRVVNKWLTKND